MNEKHNTIELNYLFLSFKKLIVADCGCIRLNTRLSFQIFNLNLISHN